MAKSIKVGNFENVSGEVLIAGRDVYKGYTVEQVSTLLQQITSTFQPKPFDGRCPYKGLDAFEEEDAELFFGRERLVNDLVERLKGTRMLFITGPSGSGKSSLARAGLIPALKQGSLKNSERWLYETMKPGREPLSELGRVASSLAGTLSAGEDIRTKGRSDATVLSQWCEVALKEGREKRAVLFIDQFEEVFTQVGKEDERSAFLNLLTHAVSGENGRVVLLFAMRSDFVSNCAAYPGLNALLNQPSAFAQIGSMQPEELVSAIAQPALRVGLRVDPDLIAQIINDMQGEPGALPLMQFALKDLFDAQQAQGGMIALTLEDYLRHGGIRKSLERHADDSFAQLTAPEQELARSIFGGLIEIGRGTQDTRRTALFDELIPAGTNASQVEAVVHKLADARLITTDEQAGQDTVTISHEKLIDAWPWLKRLVNENREVIALQNEIAGDAKEWEEHGRDPSYLYTGARLIHAREQLQAKNLVLSGLAQEFVRSGSARQRRGQVAVIAALSTVIVLLAIAVLVFSKQSRDNALLAERAHMRELAAQSVALRERNLALSLLLGIEVFKNEDNVQTRGLLLDNLQFNPQLSQFLRGHDGAVTSVAFSPDGKLIASGSADQTILLWDGNTHEPVGQPLTGHSGAVNSVAFSPDGTLLASGGADHNVMFWDVGTHQLIGNPLQRHAGPVLSVVFSPDGQILATASADGTIILWDVNTHEPVGQPLQGHSGSVNSLAFRADGNVLVSGSTDKTILLWDVRTHEPMGEPIKAPHAVLCVAISPDGKTIASGSNDNTVSFWDVNSRTMIDQPLRHHSSRVVSVAFSPDGQTLASASYDDTIILWDVVTHERRSQPLKGHTDGLFSVAFRPDGKMLASGSADQTVILWEISAQQRIDQLIPGHVGSINSLAFHPGGKLFASGSFNGAVILWDVNARAPIGEPLAGHTAQVRAVAFSPDGALLASGGDDNRILLWDVNTHERIGELTGHTGSVLSLAFSPDGKTLASGSADRTIILWDVQTRQPIGQPLTGHAGAVYSVGFHPNGKLLASGSDDQTIRLWDVSTHSPVGEPLQRHAGAVLSLAFSPDGKTLASGSKDNRILLWDVNTLQPIGEPLTASANIVSSVAFSPDGGMLASGMYDSTVVLWDVGTQQALGQPLRGHTGGVYSIAFRPDGKMLVSGGIDNNMILWDLDPGSWLTKTCQRVGRNLTRREWALYFPDKDYRKTCEQWPLQPASDSAGP